MSNEQSDQIDITDQGTSGTVIGMSWVAYLRLIPITAVCAVGIVVLAKFLGDNYLRDAIFYWGVAAVLSWIFYEMVYIQTQRLVINDSGVWFMAGILPWRKHSNGIQWRNLGVASYASNFFTYATKAYTISISDRYSEKVVLTVSNIKDGPDILNNINGVLNARDSA